MDCRGGENVTEEEVSNPIFEFELRIRLQELQSDFASVTI
jgi:hypothetical protein